MIKKTTAFYVVLVGSLASFMAAYTSNAVTMALPELARVFHLQYFAKLDNKPLFINNGCIKCPLRKNLCPKRT